MGGNKMDTPFPPYTGALEAVTDADVIIYSMGSLYTSLLPSLILPGMGDAIRSTKTKILLMNACNDRETKWYEKWTDEKGKDQTIKEYSMVDFVNEICKGLHPRTSREPWVHTDYVTDVICVRNS